MKQTLRDVTIMLILIAILSFSSFQLGKSSTESNYLNDVSQYVTKTDISDNIPFVYRDETSYIYFQKTRSTSASMFPGMSYFDTIEYVEVAQNEQLKLGTIYGYTPKDTNQSSITHRLIDCTDYPKCDYLIFKGDNNPTADKVIKRSEYDFNKVIAVHFGDRSEYYAKIRGHFQ